MVACKSPQYLNYGEMDTVDCVFHDEFLSVLWFDTIDYKQSEPILRYQDFTKVGTGYESGEYDVSPNGSLIINHVLLRHDTTFTVMYVQTRQADVVILHIIVSVIGEYIKIMKTAQCSIFLISKYVPLYTLVQQSHFNQYINKHLCNLIVTRYLT